MAELPYTVFELYLLSKGHIIGLSRTSKNCENLYICTFMIQ